jgi:hypothetical protein
MSRCDKTGPKTKRQRTAKGAKPKPGGNPVCVLLVDSSDRKLLLVRDGGKLASISGRCQAGEDPLTAAMAACHELVGWSPPRASVLGSVTIACTCAVVFVCPAEGSTLNCGNLERVPVVELGRLQRERKLHSKLQFANRQELQRLQAMADSVPLVLADDLLTGQEESTICLAHRCV